LENPFIKEVEITHFVKVPEIVRDIHHVEVVEKVVEKLVTDPDQMKKIERLQKRVAKLEGDVETAMCKCEASAAIALLRCEIKKHGLTNTTLTHGLMTLSWYRWRECECVANNTLMLLARSPDAEIRVALSVGYTAWLGRMHGRLLYFPEGLTHVDRRVIGHVIQKRHPGNYYRCQSLQVNQISLSTTTGAMLGRNGQRRNNGVSENLSLPGCCLTRTDLAPC